MKKYVCQERKRYVKKSFSKFVLPTLYGLAQQECMVLSVSVLDKDPNL